MRESDALGGAQESMLFVDLLVVFRSLTVAAQKAGLRVGYGAALGFEFVHDELRQIRFAAYLPMIHN